MHMEIIVTILQIYGTFFGVIFILMIIIMSISDRNENKKIKLNENIEQLVSIEKLVSTINKFSTTKEEEFYKSIVIEIIKNKDIKTKEEVLMKLNLIYEKN